MIPTPRICLVPRLSGVGGMVSFQAKLSHGLIQRGYQVCYDLEDEPYDAILVIGGIRSLDKLARARRRGIPIVQRLNGMNWLQRRRSTGVRHFLRAEYGNLILAIIRNRLANRIIYQSEFSRAWWERVRGVTRVPWSIVYNGVDLAQFSPHGFHDRPADRWRLLLVEGSLGGGYEMGLETAVALTSQIGGWTAHPVELVVAGRVAQPVKDEWQQRSPVPLHFAGQVAHTDIPALDRSAHLLYSADLNAACPNSVVEALACGLPVAAFDTGALPEMVQHGAGRVVPYGGDPWRLDPPDTASLAQACLEILNDQNRYRSAARTWAEAQFSLDKMVEGYLECFHSMLPNRFPAA